ncbi:PAQR family membrane homeostasis protein TrhA [Clostridium sp. LIBA-8841]|uniref:PAQR family membrane homeostasis protein TrhA n=1 Tax=Clostridium sp. LIBA-8841 TaxID=2987530 RepID=UPI002AC654F0|nr:hemolysin III family protein [Clostridium sp. LIBA-8841]MDZ5252858.1 hemolysin III family protein [Clostridium sp. LIBA-8841]
MNEELDFYTTGEEIANAITHGIGAVLAVAGAVLLIVFSSLSGDIYKIISFTIFGITLVLLYLGSTLYHSIPNKRAKRVLRIIDHSSIYLLIAGTYTPYVLVCLRDNKKAMAIFIMIWVITILGIAFKTFFINKFEKLSTLLYIFMGWAVLFVVKDLWNAVPHMAILWLAIGGLFYTLGCIFFVLDRMPYNHAIWHLFVIGGSVSHFFSVILYL